MTHELRHRHIGKLCDLRLFVLGILARIGRHIWVLSALDWRELIHTLTSTSVMRRPRLFSLSTERRMIQVIILWLLQVIILVLVYPVHVALVGVISITSTLL